MKRNPNEGVIINVMSTVEPSLKVLDENYLKKILLNEERLSLDTEYSLSNEDRITFGDITVTFVMDEVITATPMHTKIHSRFKQCRPFSQSTVIVNSDSGSDTDVEDLFQENKSRKYVDDELVTKSSNGPTSIVKLLLEDTVLKSEPDEESATSVNDVEETNDDVHEILTQCTVLPIVLSKVESVFEAETQDVSLIPDTIIESESETDDDMAESQSLLPSESSKKNNEVTSEETQSCVYDAPTQPNCVSRDSCSPVQTSFNVYDVLTQPILPHDSLSTHILMPPPIQNKFQVPSTAGKNPIYNALTQVPEELAPNHYNCTQDVLNDLIEETPVKKVSETIFATPANKVKRAVKKPLPVLFSPPFSVSLDISNSEEKSEDENYYNATQDILADLQSQKIPDDSVRKPADRDEMPCKKLNFFTDEISRDSGAESDRSVSPILNTALISLDSQEIGRLALSSPIPISQCVDRDTDISAEENSEPLVFRRSAPVKKRKLPQLPAPPPSRVGKRARRMPVRLGDSILGDFDSQVDPPVNHKKKKTKDEIPIAVVKSTIKHPATRQSWAGPGSSKKKTEESEADLSELSEISCDTSLMDTPNSNDSRRGKGKCDSALPKKPPKKVAESQKQVSSGRTRRSLAEPITRVMTTGVSDIRMLGIISKLGGSVVTSGAQVLVTDDVRKTFKLLMAAAEGIPIVSMNWLFKSERASRFLDPSAFTLNDMGGVLRIKTLEGKKFPCGRTSILNNYLIFVTPSVKPPPNEIKLLVEAFKGTMVLVKNGSLKEFNNTSKKKHIMISCDQDNNLWEHSPRPIYSTELIVTLALTHSLRFVDILKR